MVCHWTGAGVITVNGTPVTFESLVIARSLEEAHSSVQFKSHVNLAAQVDAPVVVHDHDGQIRFTGYLETHDGDRVRGYAYGARSHAVMLDKFDALGNEVFNATTIEAMVRNLAQRAGVNVITTTSRKLARFRMERGESYREAIQRAAELVRVVLTDDSHGRARLFVLEQAHLPDIVLGTLREPLQVKINIAEWRRDWYCRGSRLLAAADVQEGSDISIGLQQVASQARASRRVLSNSAATSRASAGALVDWEARKALASTVVATASLAEWPGEPGTLVQVPELGEILVLQSVSADIPKRVYTISLAFPDAYLASGRLQPNTLTKSERFRA